MTDAEPLFEDDTNSNDSDKDELYGLTSDLCKKAHFKIAGLLWITVMLVLSDVFIENIMIIIPGTSIAGCTTNRGVVIQATVIVLIFILMSIFF